jgi:DNA-binding transcriptional ArsR family regulator
LRKQTGPKAARRQQREQQAAAALAALGHRSRLRIFKVLVRAGHDGANIRSIQRKLRIPTTTLIYHLSMLADAGLVNQQRRVREVICTANHNVINQMLAYVRDECCAGLDASEDGEPV